MSIAAIPAIAVAPVATAPLTPDISASSMQFINGAAPDNNVFDKLLAHLDGVNTQLTSTDKAVQQLANGEADNLHQVMISLEQTRLAFDLLLQVRNKVLDAYQEIMRMQV
jgi:flagellar hook-basal body complex protein FliE